MSNSNVWKGVIAGAIGGLVASYTMNQFQKAWTSTAEQLGVDTEESEGQSEDPTMKTADAISQLVQGDRLTNSQKKTAGPAVHYVFGTLMGAVYGGAVEVSPKVRALGGIPFGTALFTGADEVALPVLNLAKSPLAYPPSRHIYGWASHAVYGLTTEIVRKAIRSRL